MEGPTPAVFDLNVYRTQDGRTQAVFGETMVPKKGDDRYTIAEDRLRRAGFTVTSAWSRLDNGDLAADVDPA